MLTIASDMVGRCFWNCMTPCTTVNDHEVICGGRAWSKANFKLLFCCLFIISVSSLIFGEFFLVTGITVGSVILTTLLEKLYKRCTKQFSGSSDADGKSAKAPSSDAAVQPSVEGAKPVEAPQGRISAAASKVSNTLSRGCWSLVSCCATVQGDKITCCGRKWTKDQFKFIFCCLVIILSLSLIFGEFLLVTGLVFGAAVLTLILDKIVKRYQRGSHEEGIPLESRSETPAASQPPSQPQTPAPDTPIT